MKDIDIKRIIDSMLHRSPELLSERAKSIAFALGSYTKEHMQAPDNAAPKYIWQYWDSGVENSPSLIKKCVQSVNNNKGNLEHIVINDRNIGEYIDIPEFIKQKPINKTHFSDYLRTSLLYHHGGIWVDATVLVSQKIPDHILDADFFVFSRANDPFILSNWFISAKKHNPIMGAVLNSLNRYYANMDVPYHYFIYHFIFEAVISIYPDLYQKWVDKPFHSAYIPHIIQRNFDESYDSEFFNNLIQNSWLHKLTYKHVTNIQHETIWSFLNSHNFSGV